MFVDLVLGRVLLDSEEARMLVEERLEAGLYWTKVMMRMMPRMSGVITVHMEIQ